MTTDKFTRDTDKRFTLRIDKDLFEVITSFAKINRRAIGKEIEFAISTYYEQLLKSMQKNGSYKYIAESLSKYNKSLTDFDFE